MQLEEDDTPIMIRAIIRKMEQGIKFVKEKKAMDYAFIDYNGLES